MPASVEYLRRGPDGHPVDTQYRLVSRNDYAVVHDLEPRDPRREGFFGFFYGGPFAPWGNGPRGQPYTGGPRAGPYGGGPPPRPQEWQNNWPYRN